MRTLKVTRKIEGARLPTGSPFPLVANYRIEVRSRCITPIHTGIGMELPPGLSLEFEDFETMCILGYKILNGELVVLVTSVGLADWVLEEGENFGMAIVVKKDLVPVRFVEMTAGGGRLVKGDPKLIEDSSPTSDSES